MSTEILEVPQDNLLTELSTANVLLEERTVPSLLEVQTEHLLAEVAVPDVLAETQESLVLMEVAVQGPPGAPGPTGPAGSSVLQRTYGETISALRVVYELDGQVYALDPADDTQALLVLGLTTTAGAAGSTGTVQAFGPLDDAGWSWTPGLVFAGANGTLTQTVPTSGAEIVIGFAPSATRLHIQFNPPVFEE